MRVISPTNEYRVITRFKDGRRFSALDSEGRRFILIIEESPQEAKRLVPMLMEWKRIPEFTDFCEYFSYKTGIAAVFIDRTSGERLERAFTDMDLSQRAEILRGVFAHVLSQCLPYEIIHKVLLAENLFISPSGKAELLYDLPRLGDSMLRLTITRISEACDVPEIEKLIKMAEELTTQDYLALYEAAGLAADKLKAYSPEESPVEPEPQSKKDQRVPQGYIELGKRYVSRAFILIICLGVFAFVVLYVSAIHPVVMQKWYDVQDMPSFKLDSPYLAEYVGNARLISSDGVVVYEGRIEQAAANGYGKAYRDGELVYEGNFISNEATGLGKLYRGGILLYEGGFDQLMYSGAGKLYGTDGSLVYDGGFLLGAYEGVGKLYQGGELLYEGDFLLGQFEGKGKKYDDGSLVYEGDFIKGLYEGKGKSFQDGELLYEGDFAAGLFNGAGKLYNNQELLYDGEFAAGAYQGQGKLFEKGVLAYEGEFFEGKFSGAGIEYNTKTGHLIFSGRYLMGKRMDAGTYFDEDGLPIAVIKGPEPRPDPLSLFGESYTDVIDAFERADVALKEQSAGNQMLITDDDVNIIYAFELDGEGSPGALSCVYYYGLASVEGIVVGADVSDTKGGKEKKAALSAAELLVLGYSNLQWGRDAESSKVCGMEFGGKDGRTVTAYYLPPEPVVSEPPIEEATEDEAKSGEAVNAQPAEQSAEPAAPSGRILFLSIK